MQHLLVIRNDKLGDFMLAWPAFALLKKSCPNLQLTALVPPYTAPLAEICPYLDGVIIDAVDKKNPAQFDRTLQAVKAARFDAAISFFSSWHNAKLLWQSRIPYRLAPATKLFQFLYNHRLTQRRSQSAKPEFEYNLDLARFFLRQQHLPVVEPQPPYLEFPPSAVENQRILLSQSLALAPDKKWVFVHSGSGGSANNLSLAQYAELIRGILNLWDCQILLTAGPAESEQARRLEDLVQHGNVAVYAKNNGLVDFARSLACADLFIAGSTGPLHLSAALNVATVGFYPSKRSATPLRWQPINQPERHLAFCPPPDKTTRDDLSAISIAQALVQIAPFMHNL